MKDPRRRMRGLKIHRDKTWNYSFWYPSHWYRYDMDEQYGFIYAPGEDPRTGFYVSVQDLSEVLDSAITQEDIALLHDDLIAGLKTLPDCEILDEKEITKGLALGFEIMLTFTLDGQTCKRLTRLLYNDRQQFTIYGQGVPVSEYEVFHDIYQLMYLNFTFGDYSASLGIQLPPDVTIEWQGSGEDVQVKPNQPRTHE